jgi:hypothetical protein
MSRPHIIVHRPTCGDCGAVLPKPYKRIPDSEISFEVHYVKCDRCGCNEAIDIFGCYSPASNKRFEAPGPSWDSSTDQGDNRMSHIFSVGHIASELRVSTSEVLAAAEDLLLTRAMTIDTIPYFSVTSLEKMRAHFSASR